MGALLNLQTDRQSGIPEGVLRERARGNFLSMLRNRLTQQDSLDLGGTKAKHREDRTWRTSCQPPPRVERSLHKRKRSTRKTNYGGPAVSHPRGSSEACTSESEAHAEGPVTSADKSSGDAALHDGNPCVLCLLTLLASPLSALPSASYGVITRWKNA